MQQFILTLTTVAPVFLICFLGIFLRKIHLIDDDFVHASSKLVFTVALPALIFVKLSSVDFAQIFNLKLIIYICIATTFSFFIIWIVTKSFIRRDKDLGAFVQGSFRSNYAIVGFAIIWDLFGEVGLAQAAMILAFILPLHNILSVIVLTVTLHAQKSILKRTLFFRVINNPLMISVLIALIFSLFKWRLSPIFLNTAEILSRVALPLALIGIGGSLNPESIKKASKMAFWASVIKLVLLPAVFTCGAIRCGFRGETLGVIYLLFASPTAVASFVMARAMGANSKLAGNIVLLTTLAASVTITTGIYIIRALGYF